MICENAKNPRATHISPMKYIDDQDPKARCVAQYRERLGRLLDAALTALPTVKFDKHHPQHLAAICLYGTIFQSVSDSYRLMEEPATVAVPGIIRGLLESYADLCAVILDRDYPKKMLATFNEEQRKHLEDMLKSPRNPFHADVAAQINPAAKLKDILSELDNFRSQKIFPLSVYERFQIAGLGDLYRTVYWQLCLHAHNNIVALEQRHVRRTSGDDFEIDVFAENPSQELGMYYDTIMATLIDSTRRLYSLVGFPMPDSVQRLLEEFERFRAESTPILTR
jgi:hypothetical protein